MWFLNSPCLEMGNDHFDIKIQILKLNGKLIRFMREGTWIYEIQKKFFKNADPSTPTLTCVQNLFVKWTFANWKINPKLLFYTPWKHKNNFRRT